MDSFHGEEPRPDKPYSTVLIYYLSLIYFIAVVLWFLIVVVLDLYSTGFFGWLILTIPLIVFIISYISLGNITYQSEDYVFQSDFLAVGFIIALPLLTWMSSKFKGDIHLFASIVVMALILTMLTFVDFWVGREMLSVVRHVQSIFETMAVSLLIYAFYIYYDSLVRDEGIFA